MLLPNISPLSRFQQKRRRRKTLLSLGKTAHERLYTELIGDTFIFASSDTGNFHHGFGRDTAFNAWFLDVAYRNNKTHNIWQRTKKAVLTYWSFQQPDGKIPHELKPYDPEDTLGKIGFYDRYKNYYISRDSVDATPLMLIVTPQFIEKDSLEFEKLLPQAIQALSWIEKNMDDHFGFLCYKSNPKGLVSQGWMDSVYGGAVDKNGNLIDGEIALVEAQAFAWKAFLLWADLLEGIDDTKSKKLREKAQALKKHFNTTFLMKDEKGTYFSHAIIFDKTIGVQKAKLDVVSINPGLCLWAQYKAQTIIDQDFLVDVVARILSEDMFDPNAGVFTFAKGYALKNGDGYHNGEKVVWPFVSAAVGYGVLHLGSHYKNAGKKILEASLTPVVTAGSFIEQATYKGNAVFERYTRVEDGYISCKDQTWTVTAYVAILKTLGLFDKAIAKKWGVGKMLSLPIKPLKKIKKLSLSHLNVLKN